MPRFALALALALVVSVATPFLGLDVVSAPDAAASAAADPARNAAASAAEPARNAAASDPVRQLAAERGRWRWPVEGPVLSTFRYGRDPFARGQRRGIRIGAPAGTAVRSACAGGVRFAGTVGTSGRVVSVACGRWTATYLHLAALSVRRGEAVGRGQRIGEVGRSGRPRLRDSHLAFGVRRSGRRWDYVDPLALLPPPPGTPPPALVPPARRDPPRLPPALGPLPAAERAPSPTLLEVPVRAGAPQPPPLEVPGRAAPGGEGSAPMIPLATWIGLTALAVGLVAWPVQDRRRRRRRRAQRLTVATRARRA